MTSPIIETLHQAALDASSNYRASEADLLKVLEDVFKRRVYFHKGYRSLYEYATKALGLSEGVSYALQLVLRKSEEVPELKQQIATGELSLQAAKRVVSVITPENKTEWLEKAKTLPQKQLEREVAVLNPSAAVPTRERAVADNVNQLQVCMKDRGLAALKEVQRLMSARERRIVELGEVIEKLAEFYVEKTDPVVKAERVLERGRALNSDAELFRANKRCGESENSVKVAGYAQIQKQHEHHSGGEATIKNSKIVLYPRFKREPLPANLRHQVFQRDRARCTFKRDNGEVCNSKYFVEIHHVKPVSRGGLNELANLTTLCSSHHKYEHRE